MDDWMMGIFRGELELQCKIALLSATAYDEAIRQVGENERVWAALQAMLVATANISKLLWGSGRDRTRLEAKRKRLRELVGIGDDSVLNSTNLRNDFEHFDERIEQWAAGPNSWAYVGRIIGSADLIPIHAPGRPPVVEFGRIYPDRGAVKFWDNEVDLRTTVKAIVQIRDALEQAPQP